MEEESHIAYECVSWEICHLWKFLSATLPMLKLIRKKFQ